MTVSIASPQRRIVRKRRLPCRRLLVRVGEGVLWVAIWVLSMCDGRQRRRFRRWPLYCRSSRSGLISFSHDSFVLPSGSCESGSNGSEDRRQGRVFRMLVSRTIPSRAVVPVLIASQCNRGSVLIRGECRLSCRYFRLLLTKVRSPEPLAPPLLLLYLPLLLLPQVVVQSRRFGLLLFLHMIPDQSRTSEYYFDERPDREEVDDVE